MHSSYLGQAGIIGDRLQFPLKEKIRKTDWLIDQFVCRLYGLAEKEIKIVEGKGGLNPINPLG